ncbi:arsenate reductase (glutaredoxin) [Pedobacter nyackensis]|uniref:arsenate reductase (glutaredoxin) n=1 Tax=Pedobacter nyackensis TaxID=475255 RepID=UPI00292ECA80|nr:arsenate reductase (glutaredoxin) [Pedobacter nyackensis]
MIKIYHNNRCSKSRCALTALEESGQEFEVINYLQTVPTAEELREIVDKLGVKPHELIRKNESIYIADYKGKELSDEEWIAAMVAYPILIERPILVSGDKAVIARPTEKINEILGE